MLTVERVLVTEDTEDEPLVIGDVTHVSSSCTAGCPSAPVTGVKVILHVCSIGPDELPANSARHQVSAIREGGRARLTSGLCSRLSQSGAGSESPHSGGPPIAPASLVGHRRVSERAQVAARASRQVAKEGASFCIRDVIKACKGCNFAEIGTEYSENGVTFGGIPAPEADEVNCDDERRVKRTERPTGRKQGETDTDNGDQVEEMEALRKTSPYFRLPGVVRSRNQINSPHQLAVLTCITTSELR